MSSAQRKRKTNSLWKITFKVDEESWLVPIDSTATIGDLRLKCEHRVKGLFQKEGKDMPSDLIVLRLDSIGQPGPIIDDDDRIEDVLDKKSIIHGCWALSSSASSSLSHSSPSKRRKTDDSSSVDHTHSSHDDEKVSKDEEVTDSTVSESNPLSPLSILVPFGETKVMIRETETMHSIKEKLLALQSERWRQSFAIENQRLVDGRGNEYNDQKPLSEYVINSHHGCKEQPSITVEFRSMSDVPIVTFTAYHEEKRLMAYKFYVTSKVRVLKHDISGRIKRPVDKFRLDRGGDHLPEHWTLEQCGLHDADEIHVFPQYPLMRIVLKTFMGRTITVEVRPTDLISRIKELVQEQEGIPCKDQRLFFEAQRLDDDRLIRDYHITNSSTLQLVIILRGGKPVILLYPTAPTEVSCQVSLCRQWSFSALYPRVNGADEPLPKHEVKWQVTAQPSGEMKDHLTGRDVSYLFWEADHIPDAADGLLFKQSFSDCFCVQGGQAVGDWLDMTLERLGLNTRERNDMVTFWLPSLSANAYNLISFVSMEEYNAAARLDITPAPDTLLRVFMLFRGVSGPVAGCNGKLPEAAPERKGFVAVEWGAMNLDGGL